MSIVTVVDFLLVFFFFPETQYRRDITASINNSTDDAHDKPKASVDVQESLIPPKKSYLQQLKPWSGINPGLPPQTSLLFLLLRPWPLVIYPAVIYSFLVFSFNLACLLAVNNTAAVIFESPPYNFSPGAESLIFLGSFIGAGIGGVYGGVLTDWFITWRTKKNNGTYEPEARLIPIIFPFFIVPTGVLMYLFNLSVH
jgi:hypothetical protein